MDFPRVLAELARFLDAQGARWGIAGAVALQAYGIPRGTSDIDLVVDETARAALVQLMESFGYETLRAVEGYSNHLHRQADWGRVDFIYLDPRTADRIFERAQRKVIFPGLLASVPVPEHLAAMKAHAIRNNPSRLFQDLADVQKLLRLPGVDASEIRGYFERYGLGGHFDALQKAAGRSGDSDQ